MKKSLVFFAYYLLSIQALAQSYVLITPNSQSNIELKNQVGDRKIVLGGAGKHTILF